MGYRRTSTPLLRKPPTTTTSAAKDANSLTLSAARGSTMPTSDDGTFTGDDGGSGNQILVPDHAAIPPSPDSNDLIFPATDNAIPSQAIVRLQSQFRARKTSQKSLTHAGIKKQKGPNKTHAGYILADEQYGIEVVSDVQTAKKPLHILDLPGEIRNLIYEFTKDKTSQALLVYRPRLASLRQRTRSDRTRPLPSVVLERKQDTELAATTTAKCKKSKNGNNDVELTRESSRPFFGLTQVCRQLRHEFRPLYLAQQEVGMDLRHVCAYLQAFYPDAPSVIGALPVAGSRQQDAPFNGNLTIAVLEKSEIKKSDIDGLDLFPLLDIWANGRKIEAGFGRYLRSRYQPEQDREAKDLYRLFGRRVLRNRQCSAMNHTWRSVLRSSVLSSVRVYRDPPVQAFRIPASIQAIHAGLAHTQVTYISQPYIHILFKTAHAEPWMTKFESDIPDKWLEERGFDDMEYFQVRVGKEP